MKDERVARLGKVADGLEASDLFRGGSGGPAWLAIPPQSDAVALWRWS